MKSQAGESHSAPQEKRLQLRHSARLSHDESFKHQFIDHIFRGQETVAEEQEGQRPNYGNLSNKTSVCNNVEKTKSNRPSRSNRSRSNGTAEVCK